MRLLLETRRKRMGRLAKHRLPALFPGNIGDD
jgi:hypothetical protein